MYTIIIIQLYPKPDSRPVLVLWKPRIAPGSESKTPGSVKSICGSRFAWEPVAMTTAVLQSSVAVPSGLVSCTRFWSTKDADPCRTSTWKTRSIRMVFWLALKVILDDFQSKKGMGNWSVCPSFTTHNFPLQHITSYYIIKKTAKSKSKVMPKDMVPRICWTISWISGQVHFLFITASWRMRKGDAARCWVTNRLWVGDGSKPWYLVNPKIAGKWMFIPLKIILIGIDPYPVVYCNVVSSSGRSRMWSLIDSDIESAKTWVNHWRRAHFAARQTQITWMSLQQLSSYQYTSCGSKHYHSGAVG